MRNSNSLTLLRGTEGTTGNLLQLITGNTDPNAPIATLNHSVDTKSIFYMVAGGAALVVFNKFLNKK